MMFLIQLALSQLVNQFNKKICFTYNSKRDASDMQFKVGQYSNFINTFLDQFPKYHGQFGHSIATKKVTDTLMLLAVGSPWYQGVLIYSIKTISPTQVQENFLAEVRYPGDNAGDLLDVWQSQNSAALSYNLFGFSVQFSKYHIIIGAPGDGVGYTMDARFTGVVTVIPYSYDKLNDVILTGNPNIIYAPILDSSFNFLSPTTKITDFIDIRGYDKFGSKIAISQEGEQQFMAAVGNRAWDGAHALFVSFSGQVVGPYSEHSRLGVWVYFIDNPSINDVYSFKQFIPLKGGIPLSDLGVDIKFVGNSADNLVLSVRDWEVNTTDNTMSRGVVYLYKYNTVTKLFDTKSPKKYYQNFGKYYEEDWFGYESFFTVNTDTTINAYIAAPRASDQIYVSQNGNNFTVSNPDSTKRSFFGAKMGVSQNEELLFISDPTSSSGAGQVYMFQKYLDPLRYLEGYEQVLVDKSANYNLLGIFKAPRTTTEFSADTLGAEMVIENNVLIAAAPAQGCVYLQPLPLLYNKPTNTSYTFGDNQQNSAIKFGNLTQTQNTNPIYITVPPKNKTVYTIFNTVTKNAGTGASRQIQENEVNYYLFGGLVGAVILCSYH
eukprot:NODE_30_length_37342_cov_0.449507.p3 type:complete len:604 gc:universal NODE_30_length_37342_cov_0.449507:26851-25040(-)